MIMKKKNKAWVISVDMGYGHQRAAYPLKDIAFERIINANSDKIISKKERNVWDRLKSNYELVSRLKEIPVIGKCIFGIYDRFQSISPFFPFRDMSKPNFGVFYFKRLILKKSLCKSLIDYVKKENIPFITTHFIPALAAQYFGLKNIYCVVTDTDINRVWVPDKPKESRIKYLAPCEHVVVRLKAYGVDEKDIILTGFPLPKENIAGKNRAVLKKDLGSRLPNLDPKNIYLSRYKETIKKNLGKCLRKKSPHPLTITYIVGGAGVEREIGTKIVASLKKRIAKKEVIVNLVAGTRLDVKSYFEDNLCSIGMEKEIGKGINIVFALDKKTYFKNLNNILHKTDILWTKPSELSFYTALGLPVIIAPPVGAHEKYNKEWLEHIGSGFVQDKPEYVNDWLFYWLETGRIAEAAWEGFMEAPNLGVYNIEKILFNN